MISNFEKQDVYDESQNLLSYLEALCSDIPDKHSKKYKTAKSIIRVLKRVTDHYDVLVLENLIMIDTLNANGLLTDEEKASIYSSQNDRKPPNFKITLDEAIEMSKWLRERFPARIKPAIEEIEGKNTTN